MPTKKLPATVVEVVRHMQNRLSLINYLPQRYYGDVFRLVEPPVRFQNNPSEELQP